MNGFIFYFGEILANEILIKYEETSKKKNFEKKNNHGKNGKKMGKNEKI